MIKKGRIMSAVLVGGIGLACCGVPKSAVVDEASLINRDADTAKALHTLCVSDAGESAEACAKETRALADLVSTSKVVIPLLL